MEEYKEESKPLTGKSYDEDEHDQLLHASIKDLSFKPPKSKSTTNRKDDFKTLTPTMSFNFHDGYYFPPEEDECHVCTLICCAICGLMFILCMVAMITLLIIGNSNISPIDLHYATAHLNVTMLSKWNYTEFIDEKNDLSDKIEDAFITATNMRRYGENTSMLNIKYTEINPLFGTRNGQYRTKMELVANVSSEAAMDKMISSMITEKKNAKKMVTTNYQSDFLMNLQNLLESTVDESMSVWDAKHRFEYPIVCTAKMMVNKITRGMLVGGIKFNHDAMKAWTSDWAHEDVEPQHLFYNNATFGASFIVISEFTHHHILCDMKERVSAYMDENMKRDGSNIFKAFNPFRISIDPRTVRCCVAADGNIEHDLPSNQCVGDKGDRNCTMYQTGQKRKRA